MSSRWLAALALTFTAVLGLSACDNFKQGSTMTQATLPAPLPPMRTHCVGRFLIDLPDHFDLTPGSDAELIYGLDKNWRRVNVTVPRSNDAQPDLSALVANRVAELTERYDGETPSKNMLDSQKWVDPDTALIRAHEEPTMQGYYRSNVFAKKQHVVGSLQADTFEDDKPEDIEAKVLAVAQRTRFIADPTQAGKGTCLGPLLIDAGQDGERFMLTFRSAEFPVVIVTLNMDSLRAKAEDGGLLARVDSKASDLALLGGKIDPIRRGKLLLAGRSGEELLHKHKGNSIEYRFFRAEATQIRPATFDEPVFAIEMTMGGQISGGEYITAPMTEKDAVALWDAIVKSIRLRPGAV